MIDLPQILQRIKNSVHATDPGATLILYGSYARGDQRVDSDIDILVLLETDKITLEDRMRIGGPLYDLELETEIIISPKLRSKAQWETKRIITPFYENVTREGKRL